MIKSVEIVYEDEWILVALKPENLAVETRRIDEEDLESLLRKQLKKAGAKPYLATINRLDQPVRGLVLFAKTKEAAADLSAQLNAHTMEKVYRARVFGQILPAKGELKDRLYKDARTNTSRVVAQSDPVYAKGKDAVLSYETLENGELEIHLPSTAFPCGPSDSGRYQIRECAVDCPIKGRGNRETYAYGLQAFLYSSRNERKSKLHL